MKRFALLATAALISVTAIVFMLSGCKKENKQSTNTDYLRIHIRANSNSESDQSVKYMVKEKVVEYLSPLFSNCSSQSECKKIAKEHLSNICEIASKTLKENGFSYSSSAKISVEEFPTRSYGNLTLENGKYEALIIELGSGSGDNWWCVMFPPLCFVGTENNNSNKTIYKSKLIEIIKKCF